jgi:hypothetical protein
LVGQTVLNYRITSLLADRKIGAIYEAEELAGDRRVAIQLLSPGVPQHAAEARPALEQASTVQTIHHPNIAALLEAGRCDGGGPCLVMEPLDGETLAARLRVQACVRVPEAIAIAREAAGALAAGHAAGIVHGHLGAASLFITLDPSAPRGERVKLLDLGIAAALEPRSTDPRVDCHALGSLLFEMLCGAPPCLAECPDEDGPSRPAEAPPRARSLNPEIPEPLDELISRAMSADERDRFATMAEMRGALDALAPEPPSGSESSESAQPSLASSAFDVPPIAVTPVPALPAPSAPVPWMNRILADLGTLASWGRPRRLATAAGLALVALGTILLVSASRHGAPRAGGRGSRTPAAPLPAPETVRAQPTASPAKIVTGLPPGPPPAAALLAKTDAPPSVAAPAASAGDLLCVISVGSQPWSEVWIDGKSTGRHTPLLGYKVPCGRRTLTLKNTELALTRSTIVTLKPGSRLKRVIHFVR